MIKNRANYITTYEAAIILGFTADHIRKLITRGKIKAEKIGNNWLVARKDLTKTKRQRFPKKEKDKNGSNE